MSLQVGLIHDVIRNVMSPFSYLNSNNLGNKGESLCELWNCTRRGESSYYIVLLQLHINLHYNNSSLATGTCTCSICVNKFE